MALFAGETGMTALYNEHDPFAAEDTNMGEEMEDWL